VGALRDLSSVGGDVIPKRNSESCSSQSYELRCHRSGEVLRHWVKHQQALKGLVIRSVL
jgi:hypothetical protein